MDYAPLKLNFKIGKFIGAGFSGWKEYPKLVKLEDLFAKYRKK